ncbi:MAG: hypothetical protein HYY79_11300, partial [Betaproteobacteria bacterium]|nr:hypothetical protein [Betaproteobacteria bacterium]
KDSPAAAPGAGAPQRGPEAARAQRERLTRELKLDADQQQKLETIFAEQRQKMQGLKGQSEAERRKQGERLRAESRASIAGMLNAEQRARYEEIVAEQTGRAASGGRVWVLGADGRPQAVNVRLGLTDGTSTEVVAGDLKEGAQVIIGTETAKGRAATSPGGPPHLKM